MEKQVKKVDVESMSPEKAVKIGEQLGKRIGKLGDSTAEKINKITEAYGFKAKVYIQLFDAETGEILKG